MSTAVRILSFTALTHDVVQIKTEKPAGYTFQAGQATDVAVDKDGQREAERPFTFTSLNSEDHLEFTIKIYADHDGVTKQIGQLTDGDRLLIGDPWGAIQYKGPGVFIAGGAGVTPFVAILRDLRAKGELSGNRLIFSNKTERDIILRQEFEDAEGLDCLFTVTEEPDSPLAHGLIDRDFLSTHIETFDQAFYVCGPDKMIEAITTDLSALGARAESVVLED